MAFVTTVIGRPLRTAAAKIAGHSGWRNGSPPKMRIIGRNDATESRKAIALAVFMNADGRREFMSVVIGQYVQRRLHASVSRRSMPQGRGA